MACQIEAIIFKEEEITLELIEKVAEKKFSLPSDMIKALRENDIEALSKLEDISSPNIKKMIDEVFKAKDIENLKENRKNILYEKTSDIEALRQKLHMMLIGFGYKESDVKNAINIALRKLGTGERPDKLLQEIILTLSAPSSETDSKSEKKLPKRKAKITDNEAQEFVAKHTGKNPLI